MKRAICLISLLGLSFTVAYSASASSSHYLAADWPANPHFYVDNAMAAPFNTSTAELEMINGRNAWNNVSGASMDISYVGTTGMSASITVDNVPDGRIYITDSPLPGDIFGVTVTVWNGSNDILRSLVEMDNWAAERYVAHQCQHIDGKSTT